MTRSGRHDACTSEARPGLPPYGWLCGSLPHEASVNVWPRIVPIFGQSGIGSHHGGHNMAQAHGLQLVLMLMVVWLAPEVRQPTPVPTTAPPPVAAVPATPVVAEPQAVPSVAHEPIPADVGTITPIPVRVIPIVRDVSPELSELTTIKTPQHVPLPSAPVIRQPEPPPVVKPA